jgi:hypothetical protein
MKLDDVSGRERGNEYMKDKIKELEADSRGKSITH